MMGMDAAHPFAGGFVGPWRAYNISSDRVSGVGGWSDDELFRYLSDGKAPGKGYAAGPMGEAVGKSLRYLSGQDRLAMIAYLRDLAPIPSSARRSRYAWGAPSNSDASLRGRDGVVNAGNPSGGAELYSAACATCHGAKGQGSRDGYYPSMFHDTALGGSSADNLVMAILDGVVRDDKTGQIFMPSFHDHFSDQEIAELANYLILQFGNPVLSVSPTDVATLREGGVDWTIFAPAIGAGIGVAVVLLLTIAGLVNATRRHRRPAVP
jgi:mono/diheme cytochrome c family protein